VTDFDQYLPLKQRVRIRNRFGLHVRPATEIVKILSRCQSDVRFTYRRNTVNAKSIMSLLMLAAGRQSMLTIVVQGPDANEIMLKLIGAFANGFGELSS
jgi:phosphocarrier protein